MKTRDITKRLSVRKGRGHYIITYKGYTIDISVASSGTWYADVEKDDYALADELNSEGESKRDVLELVKFKIDQHGLK